MRGGCAPWEQVVRLGSLLPEASRQTWLLPPPGGCSAPPTPGDFPVAGKVTKGAPRAAAPGPCPYRKSALIGAALMLAPGLLSATEKDRFATLSWWANRSCFFLWFHRGNTLFFQSVARQILYLRGCLKVLFTSTNTARAQGRGNPRGSAPLCWRSRLLRSLEPGGSWRIFGDFLFVRKSPGVWGGAPIQRGVQRGLCPIGRVEPYRSNTIWA